MKMRKLMSMIMLITAAFLAVSVVVMHSVEASNPGDGEVTKNTDDDLNIDRDTNENNNLEISYLLLGLIITTIIFAIIGIFLNLKKVTPEPPLLTGQVHAPMFEPVFENYDHVAWVSSDSNWSMINDAWDSPDEEGKEYGSMDEQYRSLYNY